MTEKTPSIELIKRSVSSQVTFSNALIRSAWGLSVPEKRLLYLAVSKLKRTDTINYFSGLPTVFITRKEYANVFGDNDTAISNSSRDLQLAAKSLFKRLIYWSAQCSTEEAGCWLCEHASYENGSVRLKFHPNILPHLLELTKCFTKLKLKTIGTLTGKYSWLLYETIKSLQSMHRKDTGLNLDLDNLRFKLGIPPSMLAYGKLREKVLLPAFTEISDKTDLSVSFEPIRTGRVTTSINVHIKSCKPDYVEPKPTKGKKMNAVVKSKMVSEEPPETIDDLTEYEKNLLDTAIADAFLAISDTKLAAIVANYNEGVSSSAVTYGLPFIEQSFYNGLAAKVHKSKTYND